jgi:hypothetical protein
MTPKKDQRGGKRPGAGRPKGSTMPNKRIKKSFYLAPDVVELLKRNATGGISQGGLIDKAIRRMIGKKGMKNGQWPP